MNLRRLHTENSSLFGRSTLGVIIASTMYMCVHERYTKSKVKEEDDGKKKKNDEKKESRRRWAEEKEMEPKVGLCAR